MPQDDLWDKLTEAAYEDGSLYGEITVKRIMDTWTTQKGYPVVTVTKGAAGNFTMSQERFMMGKTNNSREYRVVQLHFISKIQKYYIFAFLRIIAKNRKRSTEQFR